MTAPIEYEHDLVVHPQAKPHSPLMELLVIAGPTIAQMASYTVMQFIDTWMLSRLGVDAPTAAGNAGMFAFTLICFGLGVISLVNTLVSQNFGAKQPRLCGQYLWQGIWFGILFSLLVVPTALFARPLFARFPHSPEIQAMEVQYFQIVMLTASIKLAGNSCAQFLLGVNHPAQVFLSSVMGVAINAIAAIVLIFRLKLGIAGAAWAQNIGATVEALTLLAFVLLPATRKTYFVHLWQLHGRMFWKLLRIGLPAGVQFVGDLLVWTLFVSWIMGTYGTDAMSASTFTFRWMSLSFMPAIGIGTAVTCLVGRYIGEGSPEIAIRRTHLGFLITSIYMVTCGVFFYILRRQMIGVFSSDAEVLKIGMGLLTVAAIWQFFDALFIIYSGALRGAGDTLVPAIALLSLNWGITLGGGYLVSHHAKHLGPVAPWALAIVYGVILGFFCLFRFKAGRWKAIKLTHEVSGASRE